MKRQEKNRQKLEKIRREKLDNFRQNLNKLFGQNWGWVETKWDKI